MSKSIKNAMSVIRAYGDDGKTGFRKVAAKIGFGETVTRYALQAFRTDYLRAAVERDVIEDGIVVAVLKHLPAQVASHVCRIEGKLGRTLSRSRAERLVEAFGEIRRREAMKSVLATRSEEPRPVVTPVAVPVPVPRRPVIPMLGPTTLSVH